MLLLQRYRVFFPPLSPPSPPIFDGFERRNKIKNEANILQIITGIRFG